MSTTVLGHKLSVSSVPFNRATDTVLNVKKRKETVVYTTQTDNDNINLAFADTDAIISTRNLLLSDRGTKLVANRIIDTDPVQFTGDTFSLDVSTFLLTDVFTGETPTQLEVPLFFVHLIDRNNFDADDSTHFLTKVEVLDKNLELVEDLTEILVTTTNIKDLGTGAIFNNLENTFNELNDLFTVFYIKYTVRRGSEFSTHLELLNNVPVYREAGPDDLDIFSELIETRRTFIITETATGFDLEISRLAKHSIRELVEARIDVLRPQAQGPLDNWFLTVTNGSFFTTVAGKGTLKYEIAEFSSQIFNPFFPFKTINQEPALKLGSTLYKLAKENVQQDATEGFEVIVEIFDGSLLKEAFTTDSSKIGTSFAPSVLFTDGIRSVDSRGGFVDLVDLPATDRTVLVTYSFKEKEFEFIDIDFNPVSNTAALDEFVALYIKPQGVAGITTTLHFLRVDQDDGIILFSSEADELGAGALFDAVTAGLTYSGFLADFSVEGDTTDADNGAYLVVGEAYVGEATSHFDVSLTDIRIRGGGIKELTRAEILDKNFESIWNWDIGSWDGYPYPGAASYFVEVPCDILTTNNGTLERDGVRSIVEEHTGLGIYPIIKVYGVDPVVTGVNIDMADVTLDWTFHGPGVTYNVYVATAADGPFVQQNVSPLSALAFTTSGLLSDTNYWFLVTGIDTAGHECTDSDGASILNLQTW